jgi:hypothetical protein
MMSEPPTDDLHVPDGRDRHLSVPAEASNAGEHEVPGRRQEASPPLGRDVDLSDPAELSQSRARALRQLREALQSMTRQGFSPEHPVYEVVTDDFAFLASAVPVPHEISYSIDVSINSHPEPLDILSGLTLDLSAGTNLHFLANIDETGSASYSDVPAAEWRIRALELSLALPFERGFALPHVERSGAAAASAAAERIRQIRSPDGLTTFTVRTPPGEEATLEITSTGEDDTPFLIPVAYQTDTDEHAVLLAAVARQQGRYYTAMTLIAFNPYGQWAAGERIGPNRLSDWDTEVITESVYAASLYPRAWEVWQRIAALAPSQAANAIHSVID